LATWGSLLDASLLARMGRQWPSLEECEAKWKQKDRGFVRNGQFGGFGVAQGPDLGEKEVAGYELVEELIGKRAVDADLMKRNRRFFSLAHFAFPENAKHYLRHRGGWKGLPICRPPHVIVSAARNYAVFSEEFVIVESRQIGIVSVDGNRLLLKALALYLSSDFAFYHAFLTSTQFGVQRGRATLESLRQIPIPLLALSLTELARWEALHDRLAATQPRLMLDSNQPDPKLDESLAADGQEAMIDELNGLVSAALGLDEGDRALVEDLVRIRVALNDGKIGPDAMNSAPKEELQTYAEWLQREFEAQSDGERHSVTVLHDDHSGFVAIEPAKDRVSIRVVGADAESARTLARTREQLREKHAQWVYFDRSLRLHRGEKTYLFKPIQRMHWTRTRAMLDAADIVIGGTRKERSRNHDE
jgi:hypothetical protein